MQEDAERSFGSPLTRISHEFWIEAVEWWGGGLFLQRERYSGFFETLNGHPGDLLPSNRREVYMILRNEEECHVEG